jgi:hypothetical protein
MRAIALTIGLSLTGVGTVAQPASAAPARPTISIPTPQCNPGWFMGAAKDPKLTALAIGYCIGQGWSARAVKSWAKCWPNCPSWYAFRFW